MKIILSRKGFDSKFGGKPSPILPDGTLLSFPIPNMKYTTKKLYDGKSYKPTQYKDLQLSQNVQELFLENNIKEITTYRDLMVNLGIEKIYDTPDSKVKKDSKPIYHSLLSHEPIYCHLDPDINDDVIKRKSNWRGIFGQDNSAAGHLREQEVGNSDLFLYFGWFRKTKIENERLLYDPSDKSGRHIIYGYLQIETVITKKNKDELMDYDWIYTTTHPHPHLDDKLWNPKKYALKKGDNNTLYIARETLSCKPECRGWGTFKLDDDEKLVLTETDSSKNPINEDGTQNRSYWKKSLFPVEMKITYHPNKSAWFRDDGEELPYFKTKSPGQEYVIPEDKDFENYVKNLDFSK